MLQSLNDAACGVPRRYGEHEERRAPVSSSREDVLAVFPEGLARRRRVSPHPGGHNDLPAPSLVDTALSRTQASSGTVIDQPKLAMGRIDARQNSDK